MSETKTVEVKEEKTKLTWLDEKGELQKFEPALGSLQFTARSLTLYSGFDESVGEDGKQADPVHFVNGEARLSKDDGISVIGNPANETTTLKLSIRRRSREEHSAQIAHEKGVWDKKPIPEGTYLSGAWKPGHEVILGFTSAEWEFGWRDQWWLEIHVSPATFDDLTVAIRENRLRKLLVSVSFRNLYTDNPYGPPVMERTYFLRPDKESGDANSPESVFGRIRNWSLELETAQLERSEKPAAEMPQTHDLTTDSQRFPNAESLANSLSLATTAMQSLRATIGAMGWVLAAAVIVAALIN